MITTEQVRAAAPGTMSCVNKLRSFVFGGTYGAEAAQLLIELLRSP